MFALANLLLTPIPIHAIDTLTVELNELQTFYQPISFFQYDTETFYIDRIPQDIQRVSVRLVGELYPELCSCDAWLPLGYVPNRLIYEAAILDSASGGTWEARLYTGYYCTGIDWDPIEPFDIEAELVTSTGATWGMLESGWGEITLRTCACYGCGGLSCARTGYTSAIVTEAYLIIEADFNVGTEYTSWGAINDLLK